MVPTVIRGLLFFASLALASSLATAKTSESGHQPLVVRYPVVGDIGRSDQLHADYYLELLTLALERSGRDYSLQDVQLADFHEVRSVISINQGVYDVHWMNTSAQRESQLRPIRVPLYRGLIGWRMLLVREKDREKFAAIESLEELQALRAVQGHDWPDTQVLLHNGFAVDRAPNKDGLFRMLNAGRVDFFPRSIVEIWNETEVFSDLNLVVNESIVLVYPAAYYFFVHRDNQILADAIEAGLSRAIADGSFEKTLMKYFGDAIVRSNLHKRKIIHLENPLMAPETPLEDRTLWFQP